MLEAYYGVSHAEQFDELFGQLYAGQHPTKLHNQFLIMRFNFSEVSSNVNEVERSFKLHCCNKLQEFVYKYEHLLGKEIWDVLKEDIQEEPGAFTHYHLIPSVFQASDETDETDETVELISRKYLLLIDLYWQFSF